MDRKILVEIDPGELWKLALDDEGYPNKVEIKDLDREEENSIFRQALDKWEEKQIFMVFEEMAELQKELCKNIRGSNNIGEIAEEIADVEIMLAQMKIYYGISEGVKKHKKLKLQRLKERIQRQG